MNNIEKQLANFKAEQDKRFEEFKASITPKVEFEFKDGQWIYYEQLDTIYRIILRGGDVFRQKLDGSIDVKRWCTLPCTAFCRPASESEIKEALIKEAEKRGFKEGVMFKCLEQGKVRPYKPYDKKDWGKGNSVLTLKYFADGDHLFCNDGLYNKGQSYCSNPSIYREGKWATIVKEPKLTFGGCEVKIEKGHNHRAVITCQDIIGTYDQLKAIYDELIRPSEYLFGNKRLEAYKEKGDTTGEWRFAEKNRNPYKVKIGCTWGTMEEIKAILDACEKIS